MSQAETSSIHSEQMIDLLQELALDLGAVWKRQSDDIWRQLDPDVWLLTRNPWLMLHHASPNKLKSMANDRELRDRVERLVLARRESSNAPAWFQKPFLRGPQWRGIFQHGVRLERGVADLLRRPGQCSG
jgi:Protein of unknown function (DUF3417)